jgi:hypothetical protein
MTDPANVPPSLDPGGYEPRPITGSSSTGTAGTVENSAANRLAPSGSPDPAATAAPALPNSRGTTDNGGDVLSPFNLQPVPDPDALIRTQKRFEPPRLIDPRDRRASYTRPAAGTVVLISWPETKPRTSTEKSLPLSSPSAASRRAQPDDTGWRTQKQ